MSWSGNSTGIIIDGTFIGNTINTLNSNSLVNNSIFETFSSMRDGQVFFMYSWEPASDAHSKDYRGCYHFYEFYRGHSDYGKIVVTSSYGMWIGRLDTTGLLWMYSIPTEQSFSYSDGTLSINI